MKDGASVAWSCGLVVCGWCYGYDVEFYFVLEGYREYRRILIRILNYPSLHSEVDIP